jgi:glycosyltransferase involved in cell wall biosynthesis
VGRLEQPQKRVHDLPLILAELDELLGLGHRGEGAPPYHLRIVGDGPERSAIEKALEPWVQTGRVAFTGALPASLLPEQVYASADVLLITSCWETGPIVAWEAMAAGVPVVSSRYVGSGLEGALIDGETALLFPAGDAESAARALCRLAMDAPLAERLQQAGQRLVAERYSREASVGAWARALEGVLRLPPTPLPVRESALPPAGRLDRLLGPGLAETVRRRLGRSYPHAEPGGEWPHTLAVRADEAALLRAAMAMDGSPL